MVSLSNFFCIDLNKEAAKEVNRALLRWFRAITQIFYGLIKRYKDKFITSIVDATPQSTVYTFKLWISIVSSSFSEVYIYIFFFSFVWYIGLAHKG